MSNSSSSSSVGRRETSPLSSEDRLWRGWRRGYEPPARISIPDWADRDRQLAKEAGSTSGQWSTSTVEVARGPMLAATEPGVHIITAMVATQLLKTSLLENIVGHHVVNDPCPNIVVIGIGARRGRFFNTLSPVRRAFSSSRLARYGPQINGGKPPFPAPPAPPHDARNDA